MYLFRNTQTNTHINVHFVYIICISTTFLPDDIYLSFPAMMELTIWLAV